MTPLYSPYDMLLTVSLVAPREISFICTSPKIKVIAINTKASFNLGIYSSTN